MEIEHFFSLSEYELQFGRDHPNRGAVDRAGQLSRVGDRVLDLFDNGVGTPVCKRDPGFGEPGRGGFESAPSVGRGVLPPGSLQYREGGCAHKLPDRWRANAPMSSMSRPG
jgi:hypothetical protein